MKRDRQEVVVVTGASAGVGRAVAIAFARRRARIGLIARGPDGLEGALEDVRAAGGEGLILPLDVADPKKVEEAAGAVEETFGPIDIWINNAMVSVFSPIKEMEFAEIRRVIEVTFLGAAYGTMAALGRMLPRDRGTIIQVGSALAHRSIPLQSAYCAAKHALKGFTESLRCELIHDKSRVRVTMIQLPALNTIHFQWVKSRLPHHPQPVPPIYQPEVAARAIVWAADHKRREMMVGSMTVAAIWGNRIIAGLLDRYLGWTGYESQQTKAPVDPNRPNNLWQPLPGDHGAHGIFDDRAHCRSLQYWVSIHRRALVAAAAVLTILFVRILT